MASGWYEMTPHCSSRATSAIHSFTRRRRCSVGKASQRRSWSGRSGSSRGRTPGAWRAAGARGVGQHGEPPLRGEHDGGAPAPRTARPAAASCRRWSSSSTSPPPCSRPSASAAAAIASGSPLRSRRRHRARRAAAGTGTLSSEAGPSP
jgi:hypothetical protein